MGAALSRKDKRKQDDPVAFGGDLEAVARAILDESESLKSRRTQVRESILQIKPQLLTAHSNGMSFERMAQLLTGRGLKCSAPTLREILGIPKKISSKKGNVALEKMSGGSQESVTATTLTTAENHAEDSFARRENKAATGQTAGKTPAFKSRGEL